MHEMGIALQIVEISISSIPETCENVRVERVNLKIGKLLLLYRIAFGFALRLPQKTLHFPVQP